MATGTVNDQIWMECTDDLNFNVKYCDHANEGYFSAYRTKYSSFSIQFSLIIKKRFKAATIKLVFLGVISFDEHKQVC